MGSPKDFDTTARISVDIDREHYNIVYGGFHHGMVAGFIRAVTAALCRELLQGNLTLSDIYAFVCGETKLTLTRNPRSYKGGI